MAQLKFEEIFKRLNQQLISFKKTLDSLDKDITGQGLKKVESAMNGIATAQKEQLEVQKNLNVARKKGTDINKKAISDANKISAKQKERRQFQKQAARATEKEIRQNIRKAKSLDVEEQTRQEVFKIQKKQVTLQARENAAKKLGVKRTKGLTQSFKNFAKSILAATLAFVGFRKIFQLGKEAILMAAEAEGVVAAFEKLNNPNLLKNLKEATRGTVTDLELMKQAVKAKNFKIPLDQLATFFEFATKRSAQTGESVGFLVESIINGLGRKSALVMDNLGISAVELQKEIKKTGDFAVASGNIIRRELDDMGEVGTTTAQRIARIQATFDNLSTSIGTKLIPIFDDLEEIATKTMTSMADTTTELIDLFSDLSFVSRHIRGVKDENEELKESFLDTGPQRTFIKWGQKIVDQMFKATKRILGVKDAVKSLQDEFDALDIEQQTKFVQGFEDLKSQLKSGKINAVEFKNSLNALIAARRLLAKRKDEEEDDGDDDGPIVDLNKIEREKFKQLQENELATFKLLKFGADKVKAFKLQQGIELLELELSFSDDLTDIQKDTLIKRIELLEIERKAIVDGYAIIIKDLEQKTKEAIDTADASSKRGKGSFIGRLLGFGDPSEDGQALTQALVQLWGEAMNAISNLTQVELENIQNLLNIQDEAIAKTEDLLETEEERIRKLNDAGQAFSTKEKERLQEKLRNEEAARRKTLKEETALKKQQKRLAILQGNVDLASGQLAIWRGPGTWYIKLAQSIILAAIGAVQLVAIKNQKFAGGTDSVQLNGAPEGVDTVSAMLTKGEGVIQESVNKNIPYHKGFKRSMMPAAAEMYLNGMRGNSVYVNDNEVGNGYLKNIEKNTRNDLVYDSMGKLKKKTVGNNTFYYN